MVRPSSTLQLEKTYKKFEWLNDANYKILIASSGYKVKLVKTVKLHK